MNLIVPLLSALLTCSVYAADAQHEEREQASHQHEMPMPGMPASHVMTMRTTPRATC